MAANAKVITIGKLGVVGSTAYVEVNTTGTDENLFRLVPVLGHSVRVLPLELVPVPGHGAQISARAPMKGYVQTGAPAWAPGTGTKSGQGLSLLTMRSFTVGHPYYSKENETCTQFNSHGQEFRSSRFRIVGNFL